MTKILAFMDTEFTQFRDGQLLSLGMVTLDGRQFYAEIADLTRREAASHFVHDSVLSQFGLVPDSAVADDAELGQRLGKWLISLGGLVEVCYDYKQDWLFFKTALQAGSYWLKCGDLISARDIAGVAAPGTAGEAAAMAVFSAPGPLARHHALLDAVALRAAWVASLNASDL